MSYPFIHVLNIIEGNKIYIVQENVLKLHGSTTMELWLDLREGPGVLYACTIMNI